MNKLLLAIMIGLTSQIVMAHNAKHSWAAAKLFDKDNKFVGQVTFLQRKNGVEVKADVKGLTPGFHGFHIHTTRKCEVDPAPARPFTSAGGHFKLDAASNHHAHSGDLPVLLVNEDGKAYANFITARFKVNDLFDADGSAVIIHALPDNYANIPTGAAGYTAASVDVTTATLATGDAGGRVACALVK